MKLISHTTKKKKKKKKKERKKGNASSDFLTICSQRIVNGVSWLTTVIIQRQPQKKHFFETIDSFW